MAESNEKDFTSHTNFFTGWSVSTTSFNELGNEPKDSQNYLYVNPGLVKIIKRKQREFSIRKDFTDHYLYFCSTIHYLLCADKRQKNKEYASINYKTMVSVISKFKFTEIVANLEEWEIIQSNESFRSGRYSKGYKLLPPYNSEVKRIPVKDKIINNKINRFKMSSFKELKNMPEPYKYLSMTNTWLEIDKRKASYYNTTTYSVSKEKVYNSNLYSISALADGDYRFTVDSTANRVHTNLTNIKSDLRRFISVEKESLGQVDIKNSQPLFFYFLIKDSPEIPYHEKERYLKIVEDGKFYEFFMERLNIPDNKRDSVKKKILPSIFFDKFRPKTSRYMKILKDEFPFISEFIEGYKKSDYRLLSHLLQKAESQFIIESVVWEFTKQYCTEKMEFIATIHDSIVVKESWLDEAEKIMRQCFQEKGINPQLSVNIF